MNLTDDQIEILNIVKGDDVCGSDVFFSPSRIGGALLFVNKVGLVYLCDIDANRLDDDEQAQAEVVSEENIDSNMFNNIRYVGSLSTAFTKIEKELMDE